MLTRSRIRGNMRWRLWWIVDTGCLGGDRPILKLRLNTHTALSDDTVLSVVLDPNILSESICAFDGLVGTGPQFVSMRLDSTKRFGLSILEYDNRIHSSAYDLLNDWHSLCAEVKGARLESTFE